PEVPAGFLPVRYPSPCVEWAPYRCIKAPMQAGCGLLLVAGSRRFKHCKVHEPALDGEFAVIHQKVTRDAAFMELEADVVIRRLLALSLLAVEISDCGGPELVVRQFLHG